MTAARISPTCTLYTISGQVAEHPLDNSIPSSFPNQLDLCLRRISICLDYIGATKPDITRFMYYMREQSLNDYDATEGKKGAALELVVEKAVAFLEGHRPASCYCRSFGMSENKFHCEFEAMVVLDKHVS